MSGKDARKVFQQRSRKEDYFPTFPAIQYEFQLFKYIRSEKPPATSLKSILFENICKKKISQWVRTILETKCV